MKNAVGVSDFVICLNGFLWESEFSYQGKPNSSTWPESDYGPLNKIPYFDEVFVTDKEVEN